MPNPITPEQFDVVHALLNPGEGHERPMYAAIASQAGVSLRTVESIASGSRARPASDRQRSPDSHTSRKIRTHKGVTIREVPPYRCPTCRQMIITSPCLYCTSKGNQ